MNPFGASEMASGYATARPPVHPLVVARAMAAIQRATPFETALDLGCGAGLSTHALKDAARLRIGLEPAESMLQWHQQTAPGAHFLVGNAEALPVADNSLDCISAAGSLNYADLACFFPEAARVLKPTGLLLVYDFSPGRKFADGDPALETWFSSFFEWYPPPAAEGQPLDPRKLTHLAAGHLEPVTAEHFEIPIPLTRDFYCRYMLTETNVAAAVRRGTPFATINEWCAETLLPVWGAHHQREVAFHGYYAWFSSL